MQYFPLAFPWLLVLLVIVFMAIGLFELRILTYAYARIGIHPRYVLSVLMLSLFGSYINIPVAQLPPERMVSEQTVDFFGVRYVVPSERQSPGTIVAVNLGGAVIPTMLSLYLIIKNRFYLQSVIAVAIVAVVIHHWARPIRGLGISVPTFIPPLVAVGVAMALRWRRAAPLAYVAGTLGTLIGADLLNLDKIQGLGAPIASIGGAGTFDGIFLTGIIAVLLAPVGPKR